MYNSIFTACDVCATVVDGKVGTADIMKTYLTVKGNILYNVVSKERDQKQEYRQYWAKRRDDTADLHFCNATCLQNYLEAKKVLVDQIKSSNKDKELFGSY